MAREENTPYCCLNMDDVKRNYRLWLEWKRMEKLLNRDLDLNNNEVIIQYKRGIRNFFKREMQKDARRIVDWDETSVIWLLELPIEIKTKSQAENWFQYNERLEYVPSIYDCTGQQFTAWYKLFKRNGRWWCYHYVALDV